MPIRFSALLITLMLFGCASDGGGVERERSMLPGTIYCIDDGVAMPMQIEKSHGYGAITAHHPGTGESFSGTYSGVYDGAGELTIVNDRAQWEEKAAAHTDGPDIRAARAGHASNRSAISTHHRPARATAVSILLGDAGTTIELYMVIRPGFRPHGYGEGTDNNGRRYQLQF